MGFVAPDGTCLDLFAADINGSAETILRDGGETLLLEAKERASELTISNLTAKPVVSFLRGFSAPVKSVTSAMRKNWPSWCNTIPTDLCVGMRCKRCGSPT